MDKNGYPLYRRRNNGHKVEKSGVQLDNQWVVPHNCGITRKNHCHINTECCVSIRSVKYIHKYVYKGPDWATLEIGDKHNVDEISQYLDARWIGSSEAVWHILLNHMHEESPPVCCLQVG